MVLCADVLFGAGSYARSRVYASPARCHVAHT